MKESYQITGLLMFIIGGLGLALIGDNPTTQELNCVFAAGLFISVPCGLIVYFLGKHPNRGNP